MLASKSVSIVLITDEQLAKWETESKEITRLTEQASQSKKHLLELIEYFHDTSEDEYFQADFLIDNQEDVIKWLDIWQNGSDDEGVIVEDIAHVNHLFRTWKIKQYGQELSFEDFRELLFLDKQDWIETFFQQPFHERINYELEQLLDIISLEEIWRVKKEFPFAGVEQIIQLRHLFK